MALSSTPFRVPGARGAGRARPVGTATRGTTNPNRLRRMDRWIAATHGLVLRRHGARAFAVDLGYGAAPWTAVELLSRLRAAAPLVQVVGIEIDPARVAAAAPYAREGLSFLHGGFEVPLPDGHGTPPTGGARGVGAPSAGEADGPVLIRAANVLRQYDEAEVAAVWQRLRRRLAPDGLLVEGTCDEIGRRHVWVALGREGPRTVTFAARLASLERPSDLAERLPKALIHHNVPGRPVHAFLRDFDHAWAAASPYAAYGARQRWIRTARDLSADWPIVDGRGRWRHGELTVRWEALAPR
ncbi:SAM-dependent methyltransferase [Streptomyces tsukubensis]|uniref:SAM-dependent methyltransferase n=1 Tax=Streptomyces tsukubensis TaxID=83656 RepID=A0A1V4A973_9ACTN|nr:SAM-dependent methyltransferase [Streptomyces tsukubensis]OON78822.1 SAM-dependent methyltransferase [Streptomyces tsukubensis]QFR94298.1 class I SAM-dependent methyltransferase [Streptomyces tsukubensis]